MSKLYFLTLKTKTNFNANTFHSWIVALYNSKWIKDWWHYTDNAYIVVSDQDLTKLYNTTVPGLSAVDYILFIEVNPNSTQGWLPKDAWAWLQKYQKK